MPIYEYECTHCGNHTELLQKISDKPAIICPECKKDALKKLVSSASFHLKGSGWYETDFKDKKKVPDKASEKSETKPEAKADTNESAKKSEKTPKKAESKDN